MANITIVIGAGRAAEVLPPIAGVDSFNGRVGAVVAAIGDYSSDDIANDSTVTGVSSSDALETLDSTKEDGLGNPAVDNYVLRSTMAGARSWSAEQEVVISTLQQVTDAGNTTTNPIQFTNVVNPAHAEGLLFYDNNRKAVSYYNEESDTTINIGQETVLRVRNDSGVTLNNGDAVHIAGAVAGIPQVEKAIATTVDDARVGGLATHTILDGDTGYMTVIGAVGGLDTSGFAEGSLVYLSENTAGAWGTVRPNIVSPVGVVTVQDASIGEVLVGRTEVLNPFAIGQNSNTFSGHDQGVTTTPVPLEGFTDTPFVENLTITTPASNGSFRCQISPLTAEFSGFYDFSVKVSFTSTANAAIAIEIYLDGSPTGLVGLSDLSNSQTDFGTISFSVFSEVILTEASLAELYVYTESGTSTLTITSVLFNAQRLGRI